MKRLIPLFLLCLLASCGARKSHKSNLEVDTKTVSEFATSDTSSVKINIDTNTKTTTTIEKEAGTDAIIETITDEPIDPTKPASTVDNEGNKIELNNAKRIKQKKTFKLNESSKEVSNIQTEQKAAQDSRELAKTVGKQTSEQKIKAKDKDTKREQMSLKFLWWLIPLIVFIALIVIYYIKKQIPLL